MYVAEMYIKETSKELCRDIRAGKVQETIRQLSGVWSEKRDSGPKCGFHVRTKRPKWNTRHHRIWKPPCSYYHGLQYNKPLSSLPHSLHPPCSSFAYYLICSTPSSPSLYVLPIALYIVSLPNFAFFLIVTIRGHPSSWFP